MKTCIDKKFEAAAILENREATVEQVNSAKEIMKEPMCSSCSNPLVYDLGLDDLFCNTKV